MNEVSAILLVFLTILTGSYIYSHFKEHKWIGIIFLTLTLLILEYILICYEKKQPKLGQFMWVRIAMLLVVPLMMAGSPSIYISVGKAFIGTGIIVLAMKMAQKQEKEEKQEKQKEK